MSMLTQDIQVTVTGTIAQKIRSTAALKGVSYERVVEQLLERAHKDMVYRQQRNREKAAQDRELRARAGEIMAKAKELGLVDDDGRFVE